ncbi:NAD(P)/FAD-dependent oxidoreductase [Haladaptatus caseinilyticus]|uniref:NAD(P)/FAD-dependent oxidoreductase n=1 Tax=Haladaptatus caseinilyticus TaxID=2993314 RepID=UPI00224B5F72|nr:FAD-dependent oxidoreductase [Haladaptatus caseinilyticus]
MYDAIIVGGGIVGASVAYHLARRDVETLLIDRHDDGRATDAGAGIISPATSSRTASNEWFELALDAAAYYPTLDERLTEEQDGDTGYSNCELLSVAVGDDEVPEFDATTDRIEKRRSRFGQPEPGTTTELTSDEARSKFPALAPTQRCRAYSDAARVDAQMFTAALLRAGKHHGLTTVEQDVTDIVHENGVVTGVNTADGDSYDAETVVVAGGAWSQAFETSLGVSIPVEPQRGQIIHLDCHDADTASWPILGAFRGHYMVPWPDNRVGVGATRETDSGFQPRTTVEGVHEVLDEVLRVAPGLRDAAVDEIRVGLRPRSADQLPVLGPIPTVEGVHLATGHGATGLQLGPYSGKLVADGISGESVDIEQFSVTRFE